MEQNNVSFQNVKTGEPLSQKEIDEMFMRRCLQLAKNGRENAKPNPMVGAVIVSGDGRIIGEGYHVRCGEGHAEDVYKRQRQELSGKRDSDPRPQPWQGCALPTELFPRYVGAKVMLFL